MMKVRIQRSMGDLLPYLKAGLMAHAVGTAIGKRVDSLSALLIQAITAGKGVTGFGPGFAEQPLCIHELGPGDVTVDHRLLRALGWALVNNRVFETDNGIFELGTVARAYVAERLKNPLGWSKNMGRNIDLRMQYLLDNTKGFSNEHRVLFENWDTGCGNGVAMVAPVLGAFDAAVYRAVSPDLLLKKVWAVGGLTHSDPRASIAAFAVAVLAARVLFAPIESPEDSAAVLPWLVDLVQWAERKMMGIHTAPDMLSVRLEKILPAVQGAVPVEKLVELSGTSSFALQSVPFAIGVFLRNPLSIRRSILEAANAGGDTDTTAAIAGSLTGMNAGMEVFPYEWKNFSPDYFRADALAQAIFYRAAYPATA